MYHRSMHFAKSGCTIVALLLLATLASAQDSEATPQESADLVEISIQDEMMKVLEEVRFDGGSVSDYIETIRQLTQGRATLNIIVRDDAARLSLPSIELHHVSIGTALGAMTAATSDRVTVTTTGGDSENSFVLVGRDFDEVGEMVVLNVQAILQMYSKEKLENVFAVGLKMLETEELQLQLHEESGLLFAKGTPKALKMIQSAVDELSRGLGSAGPTGPTHRSENTEH